MIRLMRRSLKTKAFKNWRQRGVGAIHEAPVSARPLGVARVLRDAVQVALEIRCRRGSRSPLRIAGPGDAFLCHRCRAHRVPGTTC